MIEPHLLNTGKKLALPLPDSLALAQSQALLAQIVQLIRSKAKNCISFADYMQLALYHPSLGYYTGGAQKFGAGGDFVTAPEISPLFSRCLAHQIHCVLQHLQGGAILEVGAGSGQMAADILIELHNLNSLPTQYFILELSPELKHRQQATLRQQCAHVLPLVRWLDRLPIEPIRGVVLANEVCDAMPVHRFVKKEATFFEVVVEENKGSLQAGLRSLENTETKIETDPTDNLTRSDLQPFLMTDAANTMNDYLSEINLNLAPWIKTLSEQIEAGIFLIIDYGFSRQEYYHPDRNMGTLMCHYRHHMHADPFYYPGLQDITTHVDFTSLAEAACGNGMNVLGFTDQASFLIASGLLNLAKTSSETATPSIPSMPSIEWHQQTQAIQMLTSPAEMGTLFKVLGLAKNCHLSLPGFALNDLRYCL